MKKFARQKVAEEAARFMAEGVESEYLNAKERATLMLGLSSQTRLPSNKEIKEYVRQITQSQLGDEEFKRRISEMRKIAFRIMSGILDYDPFLIGSTLTGDIRLSSDIDLHAYCDDHDCLREHLELAGYENVEIEHVENRKGTFVHLRWMEEDYPVEITMYPWSWRHLVPTSSITGKPMKRADFSAVKRLILESSE